MISMTQANNNYTLHNVSSLVSMPAFYADDHMILIRILISSILNLFEK